MLPEILPNLNKIIYLDGDTMVRGSLHDLWSIDLSNYVIGAAVEPTANSERKKAISLELTKPYYNAGVLLINMEKWKEMNAGKIVLNFYKEHQGRLFANDQCAINGALKDYILQIPISYNFCNSYRFYNYKALVKMMKPTKFISKEDYQVQCNNPIIIHFHFKLSTSKFFYYFSFHFKTCFMISHSLLFPPYLFFLF